IMPVIKFLEQTAQYIRVHHGFFRLEQMGQTFIIFIMIFVRCNQNSEFIRVMIHHQGGEYSIDDIRRINLIIAVYQRMARFLKFIAEYLIINSLSNYKLEIIFAQLKAARRKHFAERNMNRVLQREFDSYIARVYDLCNVPESLRLQMRTKIRPKPGDVTQSGSTVQLNSETAYYSVCFIVKYFRRNTYGFKRSDYLSGKCSVCFAVIGCQITAEHMYRRHRIFRALPLRFNLTAIQPFFLIIWCHDDIVRRSRSPGCFLHRSFLYGPGVFVFSRFLFVPDGCRLFSLQIIRVIIACLFTCFALSALLKALLFLFGAQKPFTLQSLYDRRYISLFPDSIIFFIGLDIGEFLSGKFLLFCAVDCRNQR